MPGVRGFPDDHYAMENMEQSSSNNDKSMMPAGGMQNEENIAEMSEPGEQQSNEGAASAPPSEGGPGTNSASADASGAATTEAAPKEESKYVTMLAAFPLLLNDEIYLSYEELNDLEIYSVDPEQLQPVGDTCPFIRKDKPDQ